MRRKGSTSMLYPASTTCSASSSAAVTKDGSFFSSAAESRNNDKKAVRFCIKIPPVGSTRRKGTKLVPLSGAAYPEEMQQRDAKPIPQAGDAAPAFRPADNSPFGGHFTHKFLLCFATCFILCQYYKPAGKKMQVLAKPIHFLQPS